MSTERFKPNTSNSFFGHFLYQQVVPENHFLVKLHQVVPWQQFTEKLVQYYRGRAQEGRPPYDPVVVLKMLLVSYLYNISERDTEDLANFYLPVKYFLGLGVDEKAPDHSTLTAFKNRILENGKLAAYQNLLQEIVRLAQERGVAFGSIQIVDSTHSIADVNVEKEECRQKEGQPPRDSHASWGVKGSKKVRGERGVRKQPQYFYGYKQHLSFNAQAEIITSLCCSTGHDYDGHYLPRLVEADLALGLPVETYTADRGYDDSDNHVFLAENGLHSAIRLNSYRTRKKDVNKRGWLEQEASEPYQAGLRERYKIERKFGEGKRYHGLGRCRYLGLIRYTIQSILTAIVLNLKRLVKLLTGVSFRGRARVVV